MKLALRNTLRVAAGIAFLIAACAAVLLLAGGPSYGNEPAHRGQPCDKAGAVVKDRSGDPYICEQRPGDVCKVWHAHKPKPGPWPSRSACVCPSSSASPSSSPKPSASPSKSTSTSASPSGSATAVGSPSVSPATVPVGNQLPVTGTRDVVLWAGFGLLAVSAGVLLYLGPKFRIRRRSA